MYGLVHTSLSKYVMAKYDVATWQGVLAEAGCGEKVYLATGVYPDDEIISLIRAVAKRTLSSIEKVLEGFGEFIAPDLIGMYKMLIDPEWRTLELLLNTENVMHRVVRLKNPGAEPPRLKFTQTGPNKLKLFYNSPRKMSALAKGIIKGVAAHYREKVSMWDKKNPDGSNEISIIIS